jgi:hypothetical protein
MPSGASIARLGATTMAAASSRASEILPIKRGLRPERGQAGL